MGLSGLGGKKIQNIIIGGARINWHGLACDK
jgi:hypothetical protein